MSFNDKVQHFVSQLDKELARYPSLTNLEKSTGVPKSYVVLGVGVLYFFLIFLNAGGQLLTNLAGFLIPGYYSMQALFTVNKVDDTQWLTYWVVFAFFTVIESAVSVTYWFPFYYVAKLLFVLWLGLPQFGGAQMIFSSLLQPLFAKHFTSGASSGLRAKADAAEMKAQ